jgi:proline dehydrogenase
MLAMDPNPIISFDNTENAFAYKSDKELKKARFLFRLMSRGWLVKIGTRMTPWAIRIGVPVKGLIRKTIFKQFVGGETLEQTSAIAKKLSEYDVKIILDYGVEGGEGEKAFDHATDEFIRVINYEKLDRSVDQNAGSLMKRFTNAVGSLSQEERSEWQRIQDRVLRICKTASEKNIGVFIDAEESWIQDPVDVLTMLMMEQFNKTKAVVYNTLQLYRHDRLSFLKDSLEAAQQRNFILGAKLVRGAYMEKERKRAKKLNYPSPIQTDKEATDKDFNAAVEFCIDHFDRISLIVASHNEESNLFATQLLQKKNLSLHHPHIHFSQLFGMSDNITFNLAKAGCSVSKYLPFGPIKDVIPYLMRRAQENTSVKGQTGRELALIKKEMQRRGME